MTARAPADRPFPAPSPGGDWTGRPAPDFTLGALDGRRVRLSDFRGRVVVLNFWATWCAPCRLEMPWLVDLDRRYRAQGLEILGVSVDDGGRDRVVKFARKLQVRYTILLNEDAVSDAYGGVRFLPQTFFIGRDGGIAGRTYGVQSRNELEAAVRRVMGIS